MIKFKLLNIKKIKEAILKIKQLQSKYCKPDTIIVYHALDAALKELGWDLANLMQLKKEYRETKKITK